MSACASRPTRASVVCLVTLALLVAALPAGALSPQTEEREPVFGGLVHERFTVRLDDGATARGNVLRIDTSAEHLTLRPQLARDHVAELERMEPLDQRARDRGALAGTNGGFWYPHAPGSPNGLYVEDGRVLSGEARLRGGNHRTRSAAGFLPGGDVLLDFVPVDARLTAPTGETLEIDDINRSSRPNPPDSGLVMLYDHRYGSLVEVPEDSLVVRLDRVDAHIGAAATTSVRSAEHHSSADWARVEDGESVLVATAGRATDPRLADLATGDSLEVAVGVSPEATSPEAWRDVADALPGGPLIVRNGQVARRELWGTDDGEGFSQSFVTGRQPRTAIARTDDEILLITVDGRRSGHSVGMTLIELSRTTLAMGATDVLNLDGGHSTTMTVEGRVANWPSHDSPDLREPGSPRAIANGLFVFSDYPFDGSQRLSGSDRYETAARIAHDGHPDGTDEAVIAVGEAFPDALAGGPLAAGADAPLLLTRQDRLPEATTTALDELGVTRVTLLGGSAAVSDEVESTLGRLGIEVSRASGANRYATATAIAERLNDGDSARRVFLAAGRDFPDALAAAPPAGALGSPVLLTEGDVLPEATEDYLAAGEIHEIVVVGGTGAVSSGVAEAAAEAAGAEVTRLAGDDRFATAARLNDWAADTLDGHDASGLVVAQGRGFPDALAGGPYAAGRGQLLMIVPPEDVEDSPAAAAYLDGRAAGLSRVTLLGGTGVLSRYQHYQLDQYALR